MASPILSIIPNCNVGNSGDLIILTALQNGKMLNVTGEIYCINHRHEPQTKH